MNKNIYIIFIFTFLFSASNQTLRTVTTEIVSLFEDNRIEEILPIVQKKIVDISKDSGDESAYLDLYLKVWEIKGHFYLGQIDSSLMKYKILISRVNDEDDNYNSMLFEIPTKKYVDKIKEGIEKNCITEKLNNRMKSFWNLEILNIERLEEHFADLHIQIGKYNQKNNTINGDTHGEKTRIIDRDENTVNYSVFPSFVVEQNIVTPDFSNFELILRYEFEIAKRSRFELLQTQKRKPIEFDNELMNKLNQKSYSCLINAIPIYRESKVFITDAVETGYYKLYVHDKFSKSVSRYSFKEESLIGGDDNLILLNWDNDWDMQELYDENIITISVPSNISNLIEISLGDDNLLPLSAYQKGVSVNNKIQIEQSSENLKDEKWTLEGEERFAFKPDRELNVEKIEIDVSKKPDTINIKINDKNEKKTNWNKRLFIGVLITSLYLLLN